MSSAQPLALSWTLESVGIQQWLDSVCAKLADTKAFLKECAVIIREDVARQFSVGGDPKWAPLKRSTIQAKRLAGYPRLSRSGQASAQLMQGGHFGPANVLIRTGAGLQSWTDESDPDHIERIEGDTLELGTSIPYMAFHQTGGSRLPARPISITQTALEKIEKLAAELLEEPNGNCARP